MLRTLPELCFCVPSSLPVQPASGTRDTLRRSCQEHLSAAPHSHHWILNSHPDPGNTLCLQENFRTNFVAKCGTYLESQHQRGRHFPLSHSSQPPLWPLCTWGQPMEVEEGFVGVWGWSGRDIRKVSNLSQCEVGKAVRWHVSLKGHCPGRFSSATLAKITASYICVGFPQSVMDFFSEPLDFYYYITYLYVCLNVRPQLGSSQSVLS